MKQTPLRDIVGEDFDQKLRLPLENASDFLSDVSEIKKAERLFAHYFKPDQDALTTKSQWKLFGMKPEQFETSIFNPYRKIN